LLYFINANLRVRATEVRAPLKLEEIRPIKVSKSYQDIDGFQAALIALACIIFILSVLAIVYICCLWKR
jgi:hypothetical protein